MIKLVKTKKWNIHFIDKHASSLIFHLTWALVFFLTYHVKNKFEVIPLILDLKLHEMQLLSLKKCLLRLFFRLSIHLEYFLWGYKWLFFKYCIVNFNALSWHLTVEMIWEQVLQTWFKFQGNQGTVFIHLVCIIPFNIFCLLLFCICFILEFSILYEAVIDLGFKHLQLWINLYSPMVNFRDFY